jgi:ketopantoate reductase
MSLQKITIVGTGQVANAMAALLALRNIELREKIKILQKELERTEDKESSRSKIKENEGLMVEISILGRVGNSFSVFKGDGINITFLNSEGGSSETHNIPSSEFESITTNPIDIEALSGKQDHIFVTTKAYDHSIDFFSTLKILKKDEGINASGKETTITLAQNGIPCWFRYKDKKGKYKYIDKEDKKMVEAIGERNLVGAILNIACKSNIDGNEKIKYIVSTPKDKISFPIGRGDNNQTQSIKDLRRLLSGAKMQSAVPMSGGMIEEVWKKLQFNIVVNGPTSIWNCLIGNKDLEDNEHMLQHMASEVNSLYINHNVGNSAGLRNWNQIKDRLKLSKGHKTSMNQDFDDGKEIEVDAIYKRFLEIEKYVGGKIIFIAPYVRELVVILEEAVAYRNKLMTENKTPIDAANLARKNVKLKIDDFLQDLKEGVRSPSPEPHISSPNSSALNKKGRFNGI